MKKLLVLCAVTLLSETAASQVTFPYNSVNSWLASAARTASVNLTDQEGINARSVSVYCNVTAVPGIETLAIKVQGKDPISGTYFDIASNTSTAVTALNAVAAAVTGNTANNLLPYTWRLQAVHSSTGSWTYSCGYTLFNL